MPAAGESTAEDAQAISVDSITTEEEKKPSNQSAASSSRSAQPTPPSQTKEGAKPNLSEGDTADAALDRAIQDHRGRLPPSLPVLNLVSHQHATSNQLIEQLRHAEEKMRIAHQEDISRYEEVTMSLLAKIDEMAQEGQQLAMEYKRLVEELNHKAHEALHFKMEASQNVSTLAVMKEQVELVKNEENMIRGEATKRIQKLWRDCDKRRWPLAMTTGCLRLLSTVKLGNFVVDYDNKKSFRLSIRNAWMNFVLNYVMPKRTRTEFVVNVSIGDKKLNITSRKIIMKTTMEKVKKKKQYLLPSRLLILAQADQEEMDQVDHRDLVMATIPRNLRLITVCRKEVILQDRLPLHQLMKVLQMLPKSRFREGKPTRSLRRHSQGLPISTAGCRIVLQVFSELAQIQITKSG
ncbi:unnamed protein product [Symbiodinium microadriaticum]|nr:unnamed protein product [Symbiodinium microadriaticum]